MVIGSRVRFATFALGVAVAASACHHRRPLPGSDQLGVGAPSGTDEPDAAAPSTADGGGFDDASSGDGLAGIGDAATDDAVLAPPAPSGFAVVNSDFTSTSISLLTAAGELGTGDCIHTTMVNDAPTISGDVVLPSQPQLGGDLILVDRGNRVLTFVDPGACRILRQLSPGSAVDGTVPHDVVVVGQRRAYVTRVRAIDSTSSAGDDVAVLDPRSGTVTGRIDLAGYATERAGGRMEARPDRALIAAGRVVVSLNESSPDAPVFGEGRIVVIDPQTDTVVQALALRGLKQCGGMTYLPDQKLLLVVCGGSPELGGPAATSGIAVIDMSGTVAALARTISAGTFYAYPAKSQGIVAAGLGSRRRAFVNTLGLVTPGIVPDEALAVDLDGGDAVWFADSPASDLGPPALAGTLLLLPDASQPSPRMRVFDVGGAPRETTAFATDPGHALAPRFVAAY
jgi:hypothetical protein